jgi:Flp pilus assembly secretin CpaC
MIMIQALCIQAPAGLCERVGVAEEKETATAWMLTRREARMLTALIRAEKEKGSLEIDSRPQLTCSDSQTAFVQVGQEVPVPVNTRAETKEKDGTPISQTTIETRAVGSTIRVTPRGLPDGTILLDAEIQHTVLGPAVDLGNGTTAPSFNSQKLVIRALVTDGGAALFRCGTIQSTSGQKKHELFWVLMPQIVKAQPAVVPPAAAPSRPVSAPPPAPPTAVPNPVVVPAAGTPPPMPTPMLPPAARP